MVCLIHFFLILDLDKADNFQIWSYASTNEKSNAMTEKNIVVACFSWQSMLAYKLWADQ